MNIGSAIILQLINNDYQKKDTMNTDSRSFTGNSAIFFNEDDGTIKKIYTEQTKLYSHNGDRALLRIIYPHGIKNEIAMNQRTYPFAPQMVASDINKCSLTFTYLDGYITLYTYIATHGIQEDDLFISLFKLLHQMMTASLVHGALTVYKIMIHPETMDMKVIDLKNAYIKTRDSIDFLYERNHILYDIFWTAHRGKFPSNVMLKYFNYRNPDYYTITAIRDHRKVGEFFYIGIQNLFDERSDVDFPDGEVGIFIERFVGYRDRVLAIEPRALLL